MWEDEIVQQIRRADVAILLVSPDFLDSSFISQTELPLILERWKQGTLDLFILNLRPSVASRFVANAGAYGTVRLGEIQAFNGHNYLEACTDVDQDRVLADLATSVSRAAAARGRQSRTANNVGGAAISTIDEVARRALAKKLNDDFDHACLRNRAEVEQAARRTVENIRSSLFRPAASDRRIPEPGALSFFPETKDHKITHSDGYPWHIHEGAWRGKIREITKQHLRAMKNVRFGSAAIHPSVEAALLQLNLYGAEIEIDSEAKHGIDQIDRIETGKADYDYDFMILADANMFQRGSRLAFEYVYLMPVFGQPHHFIRSSKQNGSATQLVIAKDSSADHQHKLGIGTRQYKDIELTDIHRLPDIIQNLSAGQVVLAWEPLRSALACGPDYVTTQSRGYELTTSLYCNRRYWWDERNAPLALVGVFMESLIASWNLMARDLTTAALMLASDTEFLRRFRNSW